MTSAVEWLEEPLEHGIQHARRVAAMREIDTGQVCNPTLFNFRYDECGWHEPGSRSRDNCPAGDRMDHRTPVTGIELDHYLHHGSGMKVGSITPHALAWAAEHCSECKAATS
ncbi:hypothetical protein ACWD2L_06015 [Streptomyces sp. NPDC002754]